VQSFTARMRLLTATSAFGLGRRRWSSQQCCLHCLRICFQIRLSNGCENQSGGGQNYVDDVDDDDDAAVCLCALQLKPATLEQLASDSFYDVRRSINTFICVYATATDRQTDRQTHARANDEIASGSCYASANIRDVTTR